VKGQGERECPGPTRGLVTKRLKIKKLNKTIQYKTRNKMQCNAMKKMRNNDISAYLKGKIR